MPKTSRINTKNSHIDYVLLFILVFMVGFGLVMLYSASSYASSLKYGESTYFLKRQAFFSMAGFVMIFILCRTGYLWIRKLSFPIYSVALFLCLVVLFIGVEINDSRRWISIGNKFTFQPSELAKVAIIILMASLIAKKTNAMADFRQLIKVFVIFVGPIAVLVAIENLSTAIIICAIAMIMLFIAAKEYFPFVLLIGIFGLAVAMFLMLGKGYRMDRVKQWLNPETDGLYQTKQGLYAIGSGGLFGKGLGESIQKLGFVPEAQNDMIFTIICEELGLFGAVCTIALYILLIWRIVMVAINAKEMFGSFIAIGVGVQIALQAVLNIAVVTNSIPNTGVTLPFISYGGTSVFILLTEMGLVLAVSKGLSLDEEYE